MVKRSPTWSLSPKYFIHMPFGLDSSSTLPTAENLIPEGSVTAPASARNNYVEIARDILYCWMSLNLLHSPSGSVLSCFSSSGIARACSAKLYARSMLVLSYRCSIRKLLKTTLALRLSSGRPCTICAALVCNLKGTDSHYV